MVASVLKRQMKKLACNFLFSGNYSTWQAARRYPRAMHESALPAYLKPEDYEMIRNNTSRVAMYQATYTKLLSKKLANTVDRYILLDVRDWMTDTQLNEL